MLKGSIKLTEALLLLLIMLFCSCVQAQDVQFSQFYAVPTYQNPAFAGSSFMHRFTFHQRFQWTHLDARFNTSLFSYDGYSEKLNSGFGLIALRDYQGSDKIISNEISGLYSYEIPLSARLTLRAGAQATFASRSVDYAQFRYAQDFTNDGFQGTTYNQFGNQTFTYFDLSSGLVLFSEKLWVGLAGHHLTEPSQTFYGNISNRLPLQLAVTGGYRWQLNANTPISKYHTRVKEFSLIPTFHYKMQGKADQFDLGFYMQADRLLAGFWYRGIPFKRYDAIQNSESVVLMVGLKYRNISMGYSYDITVSRLHRAYTWGSHELNLTFYLQKQKSRYKPMKWLPCPDFFK